MAPTETKHRNPSGKTPFGQPRMLANLALRIFATQMVALFPAVKPIKPNVRSH